MAQINKIRNEKEVTTDTTEIQRIIETTTSKYMPINWTNLEEMNKFLEKYNILRLNQEKRNYEQTNQVLKLKLLLKNSQ